ncbi:MAG: DUF5606 domain-containing protein [Bacteroidia bacterium]
MDLTGIISVSGMGGLFKVITQTRNGLMIESLLDGKRLPVFSSHKISALEDISIYGQQDDIPLKEVFSAVKKADASSLPTSKATNAEISSRFAELIPQFDSERVYLSDMKKVFTWFQILEEKGLLEATPEKEESSEENASTLEKTTKAKAAPKAKSAPKNTGAKVSSKGMAKTTTVRKTGG